MEQAPSTPPYRSSSMHRRPLFCSMVRIRQPPCLRHAVCICPAFVCRNRGMAALRSRTIKHGKKDPYHCLGNSWNLGARRLFDVPVASRHSWSLARNTEPRSIRTFRGPRLYLDCRHAARFAIHFIRFGGLHHVHVVEGLASLSIGSGADRGRRAPNGESRQHHLGCSPAASGGLRRILSVPLAL